MALRGFEYADYDPSVGGFRFELPRGHPSLVYSYGEPDDAGPDFWGSDKTDYDDMIDIIAQSVTTEEENDMNEKARVLQQRLEANARTQARLEEELDKVLSRPEEPPVETVLTWYQVFPGNHKRYTYVAVRYGDIDGGRGWGISGPSQQGRYYNWQELLDFIEQRANDHEPVWQVSSWERML